jgi:uncharacterized phiE125 gp8 family phage protein
MFGSRDVALNPETPAALAPLADVKAFLGVSGVDQDARLNALIATAGATLERYCGALLSQRTVTEVLVADDAHGTLVLGRFPVISLTSVSFDGVAQTLGDFRLAKRAGTLRRVDGAAFPLGTITLVYEAGWTAATAPAVAEACTRLVASLHQSKGQRLGVAAEAVPDVASVTYGNSGGVTRGGVSLPSEVSSLLAAYALEFE